MVYLVTKSIVRLSGFVLLTVASNAFAPPTSSFIGSKVQSDVMVLPSTTDLSMSAVDAPPLGSHPPRRVFLMVEPTPFTHVSGYSNRFKEMLRFLSKAGDNVDILTVDSKNPSKVLPTEAFGYPIEHTQGFTFPLYNQISLTLDLPELKGSKIMENNRPDLIHVTSP